MSDHRISLYPVLDDEQGTAIAVYCSVRDCLMHAVSEVCMPSALVALDAEHRKDPAASWETLIERVEGYYTTEGGANTVTFGTLKERL